MSKRRLKDIFMSHILMILDFKCCLDISSRTVLIEYFEKRQLTIRSSFQGRGNYLGIPARTISSERCSSAGLLVYLYSRILERKNHDCLISLKSCVREVIS